MIARVVPSAALAASASAVAARVALLRVLLTAEAPRAAELRRTVEGLVFVEVLRVVEVHRVGAALRIVAAHRVGETLRIVEVHWVGAALRIVAVHRVGETLRFVAVLRIGGAAPVAEAPEGPISIGQPIPPRDARQVLPSGIRPRDDGGRVRACGPGDQDLPVQLVAMMVVEAKSPHAEVGRPGIHRRHAEVGAGRRRLNRAVMLSARILMSRRMATRSRRHVMVTDAASAAKKGSGFRRRFREPVLRLVVRLRIGFEPGVSLSMAN